MKKNVLIYATLLGVSISSFSAAILLRKSNNAVKTDAATTYTAQTLGTMDINCNDTSASDIRSYYSSLNSLSTSERSGTNLLKNLKTILSNGVQYYSYADVTYITAITDRDWVNSPASGVSSTYGTYNSSTNTIKNYKITSAKSESPYIHMLYVDYTIQPKTKLINSNVTSVSFDKEHIWPKSMGFKDGSNEYPGAFSDVHHLTSGDPSVNQNLHGNYSYGIVNGSSTVTPTNLNSRQGTDFDVTCLYANKRGTALNTHSGDKTTTVFEPQDSDKGRIARACLYMAARYNNYAGTTGLIGYYDPNLALVNYVTSTGSNVVAPSDTTAAGMGIMQDLLYWNKKFPPDEWEIHRNNLVYNNFQHNRNPFIDFPEWADFIWGTTTYSGSKYTYSTTTTGYATPSTDTINGYNSSASTDSVSLNKSSVSLTAGNTTTLSATASGSVTWTSSNTSVVTVAGSGTNNTTGTLTAKAAGTATITAKVGTATATCSVTVSAGTVSVTGVTLNKSSTSLTVGGTETLTATVSPSNATNKAVTWSTSNSSVATVSTSGVVTAKAAGTATITVKTSDGSKTATCTVTVSNATVSVTGVSLNKTSTSLEEGESETLTATISPSNATNQNVTWSSSNTSVATVSNGVVTAVSAGTATITVKTSDGSKTATCTVTVTAASSVDPVDPADPTEVPDASSDWPFYDDVAYRMYLVNTGTGTNAGTWYFTGSMSGNYGATSQTQSDGVSMYFESTTGGHYLYFKSGTTKNYINLVSTTSNNKTYVNFSYSTTASAVWTYNTTRSSICTTYSSTEYGLGTYSNYYTFGSAKTSYDDDYFAKFELVNSNTAFSFGANLLNNLTCDNGKTAPSKTVWSSLSTEYSNLETGWKNLLINATSNQSGNNVEKAVARYDYIVNKYGTSNYSNFIGRTIQSAPKSLLANVDDNNNLQIILVVISVTSLLGASLFIRKQKKQ